MAGKRPGRGYVCDENIPIIGRLTLLGWELYTGGKYIEDPFVEGIGRLTEAGESDWLSSLGDWSESDMIYPRHTVG